MTAPPLPPMPDPVEPERLRELDDAGLAAVGAEVAAAERAVATAMAPYERQIRELRARAAEVATETRRRERGQRHAARVSVRERAGSGAMPRVADALAAAGAAVPEG